MCGLTGIIDLDKRGRERDSSIEAILSILYHRGPDDTRVNSEPGFSLGFTRLMFNDFENGMQLSQT